MSALKQYRVEELLNFGFDMPLPCRLSTHAAKTIVCEKLLRFVPNKRFVIKGTVDSKTCIIKVFYGAGHRRNFSRERAGSTWNTQAGIATPAILETLQEEHFSILFFEYLQNGCELGKILDDAIPELRIQLIQQVIETVARQHLYGIQQNDIHLNNFMLQEQKIFAIDGGTIQASVLGTPLDNESSLLNLAALWAQLALTDDLVQDECLQEYAANRNWNWAEVKSEFINTLHKTRIQRLQRYEKKLFRETTAHLAFKSHRRFALCRRDRFSETMGELLNEPDKFLLAGKILKPGSSSTVSLVSIDKHLYVLKRYNLKSTWHRIKRLCRKSRAWNSWWAAHLFEMMGIETPMPVAMIEERWGPLRGRAYYLSEFAVGEDLLTAVTKNGVTVAQQFLGAVSSLFSTLGYYQFSHGDLKATNLLCCDGKLQVIDLDAVKFHRRLGKARQQLNKDMQRFMENWRLDKPEYALFKKIVEVH